MLEYSEHKRAKNWWAEIDIDPSQPGGLRRKFWGKARGEGFYYLVPKDLKIPVAVESAADYYTGSGHKCPSRSYGVIVGATESELTLIKCSSSTEAVKLAREMQEGNNKRLILMNATIMPAEGAYKAQKISEEAAKELASEYVPEQIESFIGYPETASYMAEVLGVGVTVNRGQAELRDGDVILVCKLTYRVQDPSQKGKLQPSKEDYEWWVVHYSAN